MHPDVAALMAGAGAGPQGPPPEIQVDPSQHPDNQSADPGNGQADQTDSPQFADSIRQALDTIRAAIGSSNASDNEKLIAEKMTTLGQQLLATHEKEHQAAMGGGPATNFLRRASGGAA